MLKLKLWYFGHLMRRTDSLEKTLMLGKIEGWEEKGTTEDEMVGWHHWLNGHGFGWTLGTEDGQGSLACCCSWACKESDTTERLNWTERPTVPSGELNFQPPRCSAFFIVQLSHPYKTFGKSIALTKWTFAGKVMSLLLICCLGWSFLFFQEASIF